MKKRFRVLARALLVLYTLAAVPCCRTEEVFALESINDELVYFESNFDGLESGELKLLTSGSVSRGVVDKEHGTSLMLQAKGNGRVGIFKEGNFEPGRYCLSFDWYIGNYDNDNIFALAGEDNLGDGYNTSDAYAFLRWRSDKRRPLIINPDWTAMMSTYENYDINRWYEVKIIVDTETRDMSILLDGESLGEYPLFDTISELKGFMIWQTVKGTSDSGSYIDNIKLVREADDRCDYIKPVKVSYKTPEGTVGNNFYNDAMPEFDITYKNRLPYKKSLDVNYKVTASDGSFVHESNTKLEVDADAETVHKLKISEKYYGVMTIDLTYTDELGNKYSDKIRYTLSNHSGDMPKNKRFGVVTHLNQGRGELDKKVELIADGGIGNLRGSDLAWGDVEKQKGVYKIPESAEKLLDALQSRGIDYLYLFGGSNPLYTTLENGTVTVAATEEGYEAITKYMTELMKLAKGRVKYVEVTNEFHSSGMVPVFNTRADVHANLLKSAYKGVKAGDPSVKIVAIDEDRWGMYQTGMIPKYFEEIGGEKCFDYVSLHPYPSDYGSFENSGAIDFVEDVRACMKEHNQDPNTPMMFTELGWADSVLSWDDEKKAAYTVRSQAYAQAEGIAELIHNYNLVDYAMHFESRPDQATFGLCEGYAYGSTDVPYMGKESYVAISYWNGLMAENEYVGKIQGLNNSEEDFGYLFKDRRGRDIVMLGLIEDGSKNIGITLGTEKAIIADAYGNEREIKSIDGTFNVNLDEDEIVYLIGDFNDLADIKVTEAKFNLSESKLKMPINGALTLTVNAPPEFEGKIEVDTFDRIAKTGGGAINGGIGRVALYANPDETSGRMILNVLSDKGLYYTRNIDVEYTSSGIIEGYRLENMGGNPKHWDAVFDVRNIRTDKAISGSISIDETVAARTLPQIAPGEVRRIRIPIRETDNVRNVGKFSGIMSFTTGDSLEFTQEADSMFAAYTDTPPKIDGDLSEWKHDAATMYANSAEQMRMLITGEEWHGADDLSMAIDMCYDLENVYIAFEVTDNVFYQPFDMPNYWQGDSIQFAFGFDINSSNGTCYMIALDQDGNSYNYRTAQEGNMGGFEGEAAKQQYLDGQQAVKRSGNKTYYEVSIPWHKISTTPFNVEKGREIYFSALVNDNDKTGRKGYMEYASGVGSGGVYIPSFYKLYLGR